MDCKLLHNSKNKVSLHSIPFYFYPKHKPTTWKTWVEEWSSPKSHQKINLNFLSLFLVEKNITFPPLEHVNEFQSKLKGQVNRLKEKRS